MLVVLFLGVVVLFFLFLLTVLDVILGTAF
jgi:hypothetical protein